MTPMTTYAEDLARRARAASRLLAPMTSDRKNRWLLDAADALVARSSEILAVNANDVNAATRAGLTSANIDRLRLTPERIHAAADGLRAIVDLPDPVGRILDHRVRPNGLTIDKVSVPLGVIFFIYESRPNVTIDAAGLCVKSGNAIILRGGKEAIASNTILHAILQDSLRACDLPADAVQLVNTPDREVAGQLLRLDKYIDLAIPRGGESLIRRVADEATMPVLKHYMGNCHVYVDRAADLAMAERIIVNAKCQRPGVCNAAESLLVHADVAPAFLPKAASALIAKGVELRGCPATCRLAPQASPATDADHAAEFLDLILSVKVVKDIDEAIEHITRFGSQHTETIVTNDEAAARRFTAEVDASAVMVNASTRFNDGFEFGLGAEIGISTDKFHARGPCGLQELCTYKYVVHGNGQIRE
ncbi:MAG: glutamate-5-semialdehyde dehydrogenase [Planctomycetes bacterium]|nr:glutamate-5-semialdehyde dehydrogenase [Planctomycetota bacterium]